MQSNRREFFTNATTILRGAPLFAPRSAREAKDRVVNGSIATGGGARRPNQKLSSLGAQWAA